MAKFSVMFYKLDKDYEPYGANPVYVKVEADSEKEAREKAKKEAQKITEKLRKKPEPGDPSFFELSIAKIQRID